MVDGPDAVGEEREADAQGEVEHAQRAQVR
jgi:hypothetical protein